MLKDKKGVSAVEWLVVAALAVAVLGLAAYLVAQSANDQGDAVKSSIDAIPAQPSWGTP